MTIVRNMKAVCAPLGRGARAVVGSLLELVYPETCVLCGVQKGEQPWCPTGRRISGLTWYDGSHLCWPCGQRLSATVVSGTLPGSGVPVYGGRRTGPELVTALSQWKYHGVRGLAWPLAGLMTAAMARASEVDGAVDVLVPIALHRRRQRVRGFNQAAVLAHLGRSGDGCPVRTDLLRRVRATGQQAKLGDEAARRANLAGAFTAVPARYQKRRPTVGLVDDLVTGGTTCDVAVAALAAAGWNVCWVATLGLAAATDGQVDTDEAEI